MCRIAAIEGQWIHTRILVISYFVNGFNMTPAADDEISFQILLYSSIPTMDVYRLRVAMDILRGSDMPSSSTSYQGFAPENFEYINTILS